MKKVSTKLLFLIVLSMGIGFSYLTSGLTIRGNTGVSGNSWDIYFDNIQVSSGSINAGLPTITNNTTINYSATFEKPGDFYEFTVDAVNNGTINAIIDQISVTNLDENALKLFNYTVTYLDGDMVQKNDILEAKDSRTYKIHIEFKRDITEEDLSSTDIPLNLSFEINYVRTNETINKIFYAQLWEYDYTGHEEMLSLPYDGEYRLEVWGAQGGNVDSTHIGGYGGYSTGTVTLNKNDNLYINVGGQGIFSSSASTFSGGYNGGGNGRRFGEDTKGVGTGGGATHIATTSGLLKNLSSNKDSILIVAGGGGGGAYPYFGSNNWYSSNGGNAGGYVGNSAVGVSGYSYSANWYPCLGGSQSTMSSFIGGGERKYNGNVGTFGQGGFYNVSNASSAGGGGGYYGGASCRNWSGGGGSGYIGSSLLTNKAMYCYDCQEPNSSVENYDNIKTISTTNVSDKAISEYAKKENGYARIIYGNSDIYLANFNKIGESANIDNLKLNFRTGEISFDTTLSNTTEYAEFSFYIINESDTNYYISKIIKENYDSSKIEYNVTYEDGENVSKNDFIGISDRKKIIVKVRLLDSNITLNNEKFKLTITLNQAKDSSSYNRTFWVFNYKGKENTFKASLTGKYKLEVWGAQGGNVDSTHIGGYGGYSTGTVTLNKNDNLYINVGGQGIFSSSASTFSGGYNGGGNGRRFGEDTKGVGTGGGATHIATTSGLLKNLSSNKDSILIVAGGGGGGAYPYFGSNNWYSSNGGNAGGYVGNSAVGVSGYSYSANWYPCLGGSQSTMSSFIGGGERKYNGNVGTFGQGGFYNVSNASSAGGGGGYYGGASCRNWSGGGGSGYIGSSLLTNKAMYCYNCNTSDDESTKTISTTDVSETPISQYAKIGNGYAKITYLGSE